MSENQTLNFWEKQALNLSWFKRWDSVLEWNEPFAHWFVGGQINASYVCLDIHLKNGLKDKTAIIWENEQGEKQLLTYEQLYIKTNQLASLLQKNGVKKGDIVIIYLPMIPEAIASMLAVTRLGATHSVVFSGFSATALKDRIEDTKAKFLVTSDVAYYRGKKIKLKDIVNNAIISSPSIKKVITLKRLKDSIKINKYHDEIYDLNRQDTSFLPIDAVPVESNHPLFILYTSGTTGKPKGLVHSTGGYLTYIYSTIKWAFNIKQDSIYWCTADIGWITGHSYVVYSPLMHGATIYIREGAPNYPNTSTWWKVIEQYKISIFYTSPTALRMFMKLGNEIFNNCNLDTLKILGSVGEPINPEVWIWYNEQIGQKRCPIIDTWWQTETGGFMISPTAGLDLVKLKPGSATLPMPEIDVDIVDQNGISTPAQTKGFLVIKKPWPGMAIGIHNDPQAYKDTYWAKFPGMYYTGDYAIKDTDKYFWLLGRADEVMNIAGHRIGTIEIENATLKHLQIAETAVIGTKDEITGEGIVVFSVLKQGTQSNAKLKSEIIQTIREQIGVFVTPKEIYFVEKLPKTRSGKIMRRLLKTIVENQPIGDISTLEDGTSIEEIQKHYRGFKQQIQQQDL